MLIRKTEELQIGDILSKDVIHNNMVVLREGTEIEDKHKEILKRLGIEEVEIYTPPKPIKLSTIEERFKNVMSNEVTNIVKNGFIKFLQKRGLLIV